MWQKSDHILDGNR
ncbi:unnamed protein product [Oppiella nova]|uniref:Uncharacterized protein n=1 Tax=Oppiella nova TaxID=334625 RepID=A0A7R9MTE0_9ACAR|nr:unnamed protein product [Oppiella nova]CAG2182975.1 unnamed protein product [Oppiella nova]